MNELEQIVQRMIDAGETEENIAKVIREYNKKPVDNILSPDQKPYTGGKMTSTAQGAAVEETKAPDTVSKSEDGFLESQKPKQGNIFDEISGSVPFSGTMRTGEYIYNTISNVPTQLSSSLKGMLVSLVDPLSKIAGEDATDWLLGDTKDESIAFIDPTTKEKVTYSENPDKWKKLAAEDADLRKDIKKVYSKSGKDVGAETNKFMIDKFNSISEDKLELKSTGGGIIEGIKQGDVPQIIGGVANAISSLATTMVPALLTRGVSLFPQVYGDMYTSYNEEKAKSLYGDDPNALERLVNEDKTEATVPLALSGISYSLEKIGLDGVTKAVTAKSFAGKNAVLHLWGALGEGTTEYLQTSVETYNNSLASGKSQQEALSDVVDGLSSQEQLESFVQGMVGASAISLSSAALKKPTIAVREQMGNDVFKDMNSLGLLRQKYVEATDKDVKKGIKSEIDDLKRTIVQKVSESNEITNDLSAREINSVVTAYDGVTNLKNTYSDLQQKLKNKEITEEEFSIAKKGLEKELKVKSDKISNIVQIGKLRVQKKQDIEQAAKAESFALSAVDALGIPFVEVEGTEDVAKVVGQKAQEGEAIGGVYENGKVYYNKKLARGEEIGPIQVNAAAHEVLHPILEAHVFDSDNAVDIVDGVSRLLSEENRAKIDEHLSKNYNVSNTEGQSKESKQTYYKEYLTAISDLLNENKITIEKSTLEKIKEFIQKLFKTYNINVGFENSQQVLNFIKEYSKQAKSGQAISEDLLSIVDKAKIQKELASTTKKPLFSKQQDLNDRVDKLVGQKDEKGNYQWKSKQDFQSSVEFVNTYEKIINGNIIDPLITRGIEGKSIYGKPIEEFVLAVKDGLLDVIMRFDPTDNNSLIGFINSQLRYRKQDVINRYAKEAGTTSIDIEAGQTGAVGEIAVEDNFDEMIDEITLDDAQVDGLIVPSELMAKSEEIKKEVQDKIKDISLDNLSFKNTPNLVPDYVSDFFKIPVEKITDLKKNLSGPEMRNAQKVIFDNADKLIKLLPKGAVTEAASQELIGTSTGVPNNLLKVFYIKDTIRRTEAQGLYEYKLIEDITKEQFLKAFGMDVEGNQLPGIGPRNPEGQTIKTFSNLFGKLVSNVEIRRSMIEDGASKNLIQDIAAGKSEAMFSKRLNDKAYSKLSENDSLAAVLGLQNVTAKVMIDGKLNENGEFMIKQMVPLFESFIEKDSSNMLPFMNIMARAFSHGKSSGYSLYDGNTAILKAFENVVAQNGGKLEIKNRSLYLTIGDVSINLGSKNRYNKSASAHKLAIAEAEKGNFSIFKSKYNPQAALYQNHLIETIISIKKFLDESTLSEYDKNLFSLNILTSIFRASDSGARLSAVVTRFLPGKKGEEYVFDHRPPTAYIQRLAASYLSNKEITEEQIKDAIKSMEGAFIPKTIHDNEINIAGGFKSTQQEGYKIGDDPFEVYGKNAKNLKVVDNSTYLKEKQSLKSARKVTSDAQDAGVRMASILSAIDARYNTATIIDRATAKNLAANRVKRRDLLAPSADDFIGLLYRFLSKGKQGEEQYAFFKEKLIDPFSKAYYALNARRQVVSSQYKTINKANPEIVKKLKKDSGFGGFTYEQALRVWLFQKAGYTPSGLNEDSQKALINIVKKNPDLQKYGEQLHGILGITEYWVEPDAKNWQIDTIKSDMVNAVEKVSRKAMLQEWIENKNAIFSENNMNKIEAAYGPDFRSALEDMLYRMENGTARKEGTNKQMNEFLNWIRGSVAVTMFFNTRSAILQQISAVNFINLSDNNPIKAAAAVANVDQYAKDIATIFNSDYLKERRGGLKTDIDAAELADAIRKGGIKGLHAKLLQLGFSLTQIGDSIAISLGGATFYRNRLNTYVKQGLDQTAAEKKAFLDFQEISEETQQSARPDRLAKQQTDVIGRVFLAFQNTPMQYTRLTVKAAKDLIAGRGDRNTNISKIVTYMLIQNIVFSAMQQAMFSMLFEDDEEENKEDNEKKKLRLINNVIDTFVRGTGMYGAVLSTAKNTILKFAEQEAKQEEGKGRADHAYTMIEAMNISPAIGIKTREMYSSIQSYRYNKDKIKDIGLTIDNPALDIAGSASAFALNVPLDRAVTKMRNLKAASDAELETWQRIALALGWNKWNVGIEDEVKKVKSKKSNQTTDRFKKEKIK